MSNIDARVRYTRMVIEDSFLELLKKKPVAKITVTELCKLAQINRATFYKHYLDIPDLLEQMEEEIFERMRMMFENLGSDFKTFMREMVNLMDFTVGDNTKRMILGSDNGDPELMSKTLLICYEKGYPMFSEGVSNMSEDKRRMLYHFISYGSAAVLRYWITNGMKESSEEILDTIVDFCTKSIEGVAE